MKTTNLLFPALLLGVFFFLSFPLTAQEKTHSPCGTSEIIKVPGENTAKGTVLVTATTEYDSVVRFTLSISGRTSHYSQVIEGAEIILEVDPGTYTTGTSSGDVKTNGKNLHVPCTFSPRSFTIAAGEYVVVTATL